MPIWAPQLERTRPGQMRFSSRLALASPVAAVHSGQGHRAQRAPSGLMNKVTAPDSAGTAPSSTSME